MELFMFIFLASMLCWFILFGWLISVAMFGGKYGRD